MGITQKEIAKNLGISYMTVSRVLNSNGYVSDALKQRVLEYAKEMGYEPHRASQVLVRNSTRRLALFSSTLPRYFWDEINKGVQVAAQQLKAFDYEVHYHRVPELDTQAYLALLEQEIEQGVDAVALVNQRMYDIEAVITCIEQAGLPYVTFNIDAPHSKRCTYIGSDYIAGGRLAADFIARTLQLSQKKEVLVLQCSEQELSQAKGPNINKMRLEGFLDLMNQSFPEITVHLEYFDTKLQAEEKDNQILNLVRNYQNKVQAMYLIPAFNTDFLHALDAAGVHDTITVLHDLDSAALYHLKTRLLSAVIDQSPTLQGYYTVMALEKILESKQPADLPLIQIDHNLVLTENRNLIHGLSAARLMS
ncbi:MAG: LacI family DNA-binding transcriptional regulator [Sphaerochaeta sp.]|nr:LacI family DNA-binding transcriptional regulator [Sphaerochaeta sp.]